MEAGEAAAENAPAENLDAFKEQLIKASARIVLAVIVVLCVTVYLYMPTKKQLVQQVITRDRRSVIKFKGKVPMPAVLRALRAAIHAPNHFLNEPWRFRLLGPETQKKILQLNESKRELLESVPGWLMVSVVPTPGESKWNVKALEDHAATACAVQNFMLSLASEGFASKWLTGAIGVPASKLMEAAGVSEETEHLMGIIFFGQPTQPPSTMPVPERKHGINEPVLQTTP